MRPFRRPASLAAVCAVLSPVLFAGLAVSPAAAATTVELLRVPADASGIGTGLTSAERAKLFEGVSTANRAPITRLPVSAVNAGKLTKGVTTIGGGATGVGLVGLSIGWSVTNTGLELFGVDPKDTGASGLQQILGITPDSDYVPDFDGGVSGEGWDVLPQYGVSPEQAARTFAPSGYGAAGLSVVDDPGPYTGTRSRYMGLRYEYASPNSASALSAILGLEIVVKCRSASTGKVYEGIPFSLGNWETGYTYRELDIQGMERRIIEGPNSAPDNCGTASAERPLEDEVVGFVVDRTRSSLKGEPVGPGRATYWRQGTPEHNDFPGEGKPRLWETQSTCKDGLISLSKSALFQEKDATYPGIPAATCPDGSTPSHVDIWQRTPDAPELDTRVGTSDIPSGTGDWFKNYPQCSTEVCVLDLQRTDPNTGEKTSCAANWAACTGWASDPQRPRDYQCTYAGQPVGIEQCRTYQRTPTAAPHGPESRYTPPEVALPPVGGPATDSYKPPSPTPETGGDPDPSDESCPPKVSLTSFITGKIVYQAVTCALSWAFVPSPQSVDAVKGQLTDAVTGTALGDVATVSGDLGDSFTGIAQGSCNGLGFDMGAIDDRMSGQVFSPFYTCSGVAKDVSDFARPLLVAGLWLVAVSTSTWMVMSSFGLRL